jgi:hypothetical protein
MADIGIKKVTILKSDIKSIGGVSQNYVLRYRVISEDKNRSSHWSPQYSLSVPSLDPILNPTAYSVTVVGSTITCVWEHAQGQSADKYDVYVNWDSVSSNDAWEYITTVNSPSYATIKRSGATKFKIAVQVPTFPKQRFTGSTLFDSIQYNV